MRRRTFLGALITSAALGDTAILTSKADAHSLEDFVALRARWETILTGGDSVDTADYEISKRITSITNAAVSAWSSMDMSANRAYLWESEKDVTLATVPEQKTATYARLASMVCAYRTRGSTLEQSAELRNAVVDALNWLYVHVYNETMASAGNWWDWSIGVPQQLVGILELMYDDLSLTRIDSYLKPVLKHSGLDGMTGANRVWIADILAKAGTLLGDGEKIATARDAVVEVLPYVTQGDGFYTDGSFIQHLNVAYTGSYGLALLTVLASLINWLRGSPWQVTDPRVANVSKWVSDSFAPLMYHGHMMDMVRGRVISRSTSTDLDAGSAVIGGVLDVAEFASGVGERTNLRSMVKEWMDPVFWTGASVRNISRAKAIISDLSIPTSSSPGSCTQYAAMDRAVQHCDGHAFAVSMSSNRIVNYESINEENVRGWYTGSGMTYLYNADAYQYTRDFWPTVDPYRLPGTTVETTRLADGQGQGWPAPTGDAGGTVILGMYGTCGMRLIQPGGLTGNKSWFLLGDKVVSLGSGITSGGPNPVESIVENRKLSSRGDNSMTINGQIVPSSLGWSDTIENVRIAHLAGDVPGSDIGYYFPTPVILHALRESRTGNWSDIDKRPTADTSPVTACYATIWLDHGIRPLDVSYAYAIMPELTDAQLTAYAEKPDFTILANSREVQAVFDHRLQITAAQFWSGGSATAGEITSDMRSAIMTAATLDGLSVSVSDPAQGGTTIRVEIARPATGIDYVDPGVNVVQLTPSIKLEVTPIAGQTSNARFFTSARLPTFGPLAQ